MAEKPIENSIAYTFHLEGKSIFTRGRYRKRAIELKAALDVLLAWHDLQQSEGITSYFNKDSWLAIRKGLSADIETLARLATDHD